MKYLDDQSLQPLPPPSPLLSSPLPSPHLTSPPLLSSPPPPLQYRDGSVVPASSHSCWLSRGWQWPDSPGPWLGTLHGSYLQIRSLLSLQTPSGKGVGEGREEHEALVLNHVPHNWRYGLRVRREEGGGLVPNQWWCFFVVINNNSHLYSGGGVTITVGDSFVTEYTIMRSLMFSQTSKKALENTILSGDNTYCIPPWFFISPPPPSPHKVTAPPPFP